VAPVDAGATLPRQDGGAISADGPTSDSDIATAVPAGWVPFTGYPNPACQFYVPPSRDLLPPPIEWEPCDPEMQPAGIACEQMKITWPARTSDNPVAWLLASQASVQPNGTYTMAVARELPGMTYYVVADADGPVHSAVLSTNESQCRLYPDDLQDGRVVYHVYEAGSSAAQTRPLEPHLRPGP
jgi:hypothetical protein